MFTKRGWLLYLTTLFLLLGLAAGSTSASPSWAIPDNLQQVAARPYDSAGNAIENTSFTAIAAAPGTTTTSTSGNVLNTRGRGISCLMDLVGHTGASLRPAIDGYDPLSGTYYPILLANTPQTTTGQVRFSVYPAAIAASAQITSAATGTIGVNDVLPRVIRVRSVAANSASHTVTVGCDFLAY